MIVHSQANRDTRPHLIGGHGDYVWETGSFMRQDDFSFKPQLKLVIVGNSKPAFSNVDGAIKRRFNVLPFEHVPDTPLA